MSHADRCTVCRTLLDRQDVVMFDLKRDRGPCCSWACMAVAPVNEPPPEDEHKHDALMILTASIMGWAIVIILWVLN